MRFLNKTMVLLDDVVQIRTGSASAAASQLAATLQLRDGAGIGWMAIEAPNWC
jgi:hypothetical protein